MRQTSYNKKTSQQEYHVFQRVLWNVNAKYSGNAKKLGPKWIGPYEIVDIFNEGQNYKLRVIPLPPKEQHKFMNTHKTPKRVSTLPGDHSNYHPVNEFIVPRNQIKPYFASFEQQFDGMQTPIKLILNNLTNVTSSVLQHHQMFTLFNVQNNMRYTIET